MNVRQSGGLYERYTQALSSYLTQPDPADLSAAQAIGRAAVQSSLGFASEAALSEAYELGRAAVGAGFGVLDMTHLHHEALHRLSQTAGAELLQEQIDRAGEFLSESLSAFEIMLLGYREANARLASLNAELSHARDAAEAASQAKGMFVATVSHEIRTPMNGVIGMLDVLARSALSHDQMDAVKTIRDSAFTLLHLIDDILDFSKIEANRLDLELAPVPLGDLVEGLCVSLAPVAEARGVDIHPFIDPSLPAWVEGDPVRLRQILANLVGNALKFSGNRPQQRGQVSVRLEPGEGGVLRLSVADNGIGMSSAVVERLFSAPFMQAEATTTRRFGGSGLGLVICKRLVDLMGGDIRVESQPGVGSTFRVSLYLPATAGEDAAPAPELDGIDCFVVSGPGAGTGFNAEDCRRYLTAAGARVQLCPSLLDAMRQAHSTAHPVVIQAPGPAGAGALGEVLEQYPQVHHLLLCRSPFPSLAGVSTLVGGVLRRAALVRAVAATAGRASPELHHHDHGWQELVHIHAAPPSVEQARAEGRLILLAEDDETNRKVILKQLSLLGYAAEVANDGREALMRYQHGGYALLLTDLHMPELDGYSLAHAIRSAERAGDGGQGLRLPILALTANAQREEAARVLAAGMDEYLTKPIQLHQLQAALNHWLPLPAGSGVGPVPEPGRAPALDIRVLDELLAGRIELRGELLGDYLVSLRRLRAELLDAAARGQLRDVAVRAHTLKSPSRSMGALVLGELCLGLEEAGFAADAGAVSSRLPAFTAEAAAVEAAVLELVPDAGGEGTEPARPA